MNRPITTLRYSALAEGVSYLVLLFIAMPLKYAAGIDEAVRWVGWLHGLLFILLCSSLLWAKFKGGLGWPLGWLVFFASLVPFGAFWADAKLRRRYAPCGCKSQSTPTMTSA